MFLCDALEKDLISTVSKGKEVCVLYSSPRDSCSRV